VAALLTPTTAAGSPAPAAPVGSSPAGTATTARHADDGTTTRRVLDRAPQHPGRYKKENAELKRANEILKAAASFFAAELCATRRDVDREAVKGRIRWAVAAA
jgi:transposase